MRLEPHFCGISYRISEKKIYTMYALCLLRFFFSSPLPKLVLVICFEIEFVYECFFSRSLIWRCHSTLFCCCLHTHMPWHDTLLCRSVLSNKLTSFNQWACDTFDIWLKTIFDISGHWYSAQRTFNTIEMFIENKYSIDKNI